MVVFIQQLSTWIRARIELARADEAGLTTTEYVALGAVILVAVGAVAALIANYIGNKGSDIVRTP